MLGRNTLHIMVQAWGRKERFEGVFFLAAVAALPIICPRAFVTPLRIPYQCVVSFGCIAVCPLKSESDVGVVPGFFVPSSAMRASNS